MRTAMIVDDDEQTRCLTSEMLEASGVTVIAQARDGKEAVEYFERLRPEITLLDVSMPRYDGLYALERIHRHDPYAKVIMITGDKTKDTQERLSLLRPAAVLYKPLDFAEMLDIIEK